MISRYGRLDRLLSAELKVSRRALRSVLARGRVQVDGVAVHRGDVRIGPFQHVCVDGAPVRPAQVPVYLMMNKPAGVVSATRDARHSTVMELLRETPYAGVADELHIAGRLDATSTGLLLLTNDGAWSRALSLPEKAVEKRYRVTVEKPLTAEDVHAFAAGMWFPTEGITTRAARLVPLAFPFADVALVEGRYHQVRRMFARRGNRVVALHRSAIGDLQMPDTLAPGQVAEVPAHCLCHQRQCASPVVADRSIDSSA